MLRKKIRIPSLLAAVALCLVISERPGRGTITSITLTPANPTTMSNGLAYYLAGKDYVFTINVIDPDVTAWNQITDVRIIIPNATNIVVQNTDPLTGTGAFDVTVASGTVTAIGNITPASTFNNFTAEFTVTFRWDTPESPWAAARNVTGSATTDTPTTNMLTDIRPVSYGVVSTIRIIGFAQDGDAADGRVNPWHTAFNVTGTITYNIPGATTADAVHLVADADLGEIDTITLVHSSGSTVSDDDNNEANLSIPVPAEWMNNTPARGNRTWSIQAAMNTDGGPATSVNTLPINCDRIQVTNIEFLGGGGTNSPQPYYRSVNLTGTQVRVTAQLESAGTPMLGNTTIRIGEFDGADNPTVATTDVVIANGANTGVAALSYPPGAATPAGSTTPLRYGAIRVFGGAYDGDTAEGQDDFVKIPQAALGTYQIYWDHNDPPGKNNTAFTDYIGHTSLPTSITFEWEPIAPLIDNDHDFYSYKIYYRESNPSNPWIMIDRNTPGYGNTGPYRLNDISTGLAAIEGLVPLTNYDFFITAIDVFGNEGYILFPGTQIPNPFGTTNTTAQSITVTLTDGITTYNDASFTANASATARPLRESAIRIQFNIVGIDQTLPDEVYIIAAADGPGPLITSGVITIGVVEGTDYFRILCVRSGPNIWNGYIPTTNPLITVGSDVRFLIETVKGGVSSYSDHDSELDLPGDPDAPNNYPWTFRIETPTTFQPWPTRILNNVITDKDPVAYPAYYLSEDAYVTIKVFDIKGRPVATLLDNAFRKGGQNIKEGGWRGYNKANRKLGVGLYYIQIEAKAVSSGKVILNSFQKVVMAR